MPGGGRGKGRNCSLSVYSAGGPFCPALATSSLTSSKKPPQLSLPWAERAEPTSGLPAAGRIFCISPACL